MGEQEKAIAIGVAAADSFLRKVLGKDLAKGDDIKNPAPEGPVRKPDDPSHRTLEP